MDSSFMDVEKQEITFDHAGLLFKIVLYSLLSRKVLFFKISTTTSPIFNFGQGSDQNAKLSANKIRNSATWDLTTQTGKE